MPACTQFLCTQSFIHLLVVWSTNSTLPTVCMHIYLRIVLCNSEFDHSWKLHSETVTSSWKWKTNNNKYKQNACQTGLWWKILGSDQCWVWYRLHHWFYHWLFETMFCSADTSDHIYIYIYIFACAHMCMCKHVCACASVCDVTKFKSNSLSSFTIRHFHLLLLIRKILRRTVFTKAMT